MGLEKLELDNRETLIQNSPIASCNFDASLVLSNFLPASRIRQMYANHEPILNYFLGLGDKSNGNSM